MIENLPHDWEMTPRYRVLDSAIHRVTLAGVLRWQLHLIKRPAQDASFLWLRPLHFGDDAGFVAFSEEHQREHIFGARQTLQTAERKIYAMIGADALARRFVLNTRGELRRDNQRAHDILTVARDGVAAWSHGADAQGSPFPWRALKTPLRGADFVSIPAVQIWNELQPLLANPDGEANFARRFSRLNLLERRARIQQTARGNLDELNGLLNDVVLAAPQWAELESESELFLSLDKAGLLRMWEVGHGQSRELETSAFVRENVRALWRYFQPFDHQIADYLCVKNSDEDSLFARAFAPSAHQKLEAQLRLRDWSHAR